MLVAVTDVGNGRWRYLKAGQLAGQYLDILTRARRDERPQTAMHINRYKTAAYTVERPLHLGVEIAGAHPVVIRAYRDFGADVGVAFQLRDDLLGMFGNPAITVSRPARTC